MRVFRGISRKSLALEIIMGPCKARHFCCTTVDPGVAKKPSILVISTSLISTIHTISMYSLTRSLFQTHRNLIVWTSPIAFEHSHPDPFPHCFLMIFAAVYATYIGACFFSFHRDFKTLAQMIFLRHGCRVVQSFEH